MKHLDSMLPYVCSAIDHRRRQNVVVVVVCGFSMVYCERQKPRHNEIERIINDTHSKMWKCSECGFGQGLSVHCGTSVPFSVQIECVDCVEGESYSDSHSYSSCKRCRQCAEHEKISGKCMKEKDTTECLKTCHRGFYWDDLTDSCHPCSNCCKEASALQKHCEDSGSQCGNYTNMCENPTTTTQDKEKANQYGNPEKEGLSVLQIVVAIVIPTLLIIVVVVVIILFVMWKLYDRQEAKNLLRNCFCFCCCAANSNNGNTMHFNDGNFIDNDPQPTTRTESEIHLGEATDQIGSLKSVNKEMHSIPPVGKRPKFLRLCSVPVETHPIVKSDIPRSQSHPGALKDLNKELPEDKPATFKRYASDWKTKKYSKKGYIRVPTDSDVPDSIAVQGPACAESREEKPKKLGPPTFSSKDQFSTSVAGLHHSTNTLAADVPQEFQNRLLRRKMTDIPINFYRKICNKLDTLRVCFWDDYRMLGEAIGLGKDEVLLLGQIGSPTDKMMQKFDSQRGSSIGKFKSIVEGMGRDDVVSVLNEWLVHEYKSYAQRC